MISAFLRKHILRNALIAFSYYFEIKLIIVPYLWQIKLPYFYLACLEVSCYLYCKYVPTIYLL